MTSPGPRRAPIPAAHRTGRAEPTCHAAPRWDARCSEILRRMAGRHRDHEICVSIAAETGKRFMPRTVAEYRRAGDLPPCRRNDWTAALKAWRGRKAWSCGADRRDSTPARHANANGSGMTSG